jgi:hypothetical protein
MALITVAGVALPTPAEFQIGYMDISKAERNANGNMIIERIATKRKLFLTYAFLTTSELSLILQKIAPAYYDVTYLDAHSNTFKTGSFYCGDRTMGMVDYVDGIARYKEFTFNLIER